MANGIRMNNEPSTPEPLGPSRRGYRCSTAIADSTAYSCTIKMTVWSLNYVELGLYISLFQTEEKQSTKAMHCQRLTVWVPVASLGFLQSGHFQGELPKAWWSWSCYPIPLFAQKRNVLITFLQVIPALTLICHSFWHVIWKYIWYNLLAFYLAVYLTVYSRILFGIYSDILFWHSIWYIFGDSLWLRSGGEHFDPELAVEVRRGTLWSGACGGWYAPLALS
jgi:hypothetical protein